jgi:hypothetical protein
MSLRYDDPGEIAARLVLGSLLAGRPGGLVRRAIGAFPPKVVTREPRL